MLATSTLIFEFALRASTLHRQLAHRAAYIEEIEAEEEEDTNSLDTLAPTAKAPPPRDEEEGPTLKVVPPATGPGQPR